MLEGRVGVIFENDVKLRLEKVAGGKKGKIFSFSLQWYIVYLFSPRSRFHI
jgi:hypothetical protein